MKNHSQLCAVACIAWVVAGGAMGMEQVDLTLIATGGPGRTNDPVSSGVPLPDGFSLEYAAQRLGMAVVADESTGRWALGPESLNGQALVTAEAPDLVLDDIDGNEFRLSSLRGKKVVLVAWAPY